MGFRGQPQRQVISPMVDIPLVPKEQKEGVALVVSDLVDQSSFPILQLYIGHTPKKKQKLRLDETGNSIIAIVINAATAIFLTLLL